MWLVFVEFVQRARRVDDENEEEEDRIAVKPKSADDYVSRAA